MYRYIATEPSGASRKGELTADSAYQVRVALRRMDLVPERVTEVAGPGRRAWAMLGQAASARLASGMARLGRARRRAELVELYESMATLLGTGATLAASLDLIAAHNVGSSASVARALSERVKRGDSLSAAMAQPLGSPWFGPLDLALIRVAQESGELERAFSDLAELHGRSEGLKSRFIAALAYPALLLVFGLGVVVFLTTTTLPPLAAVLKDGGVDLPAATAVLLALGEVVTHRWPWLLLIAPAILWCGWMLATSPRWAAARLRIPLVGPAVLRAQLAEACLLLSRLLTAGLPLNEALKLVVPSVPNAAVAAALSRLRTAVESGHDTAEALGRESVFEPVFRRVLAVGDASGELPATLMTLGTRYRQSAARLTDRLAAALEPAAILVLAAMVGFVVYAAITPMLRLSQTIH